MSKIVIVEDETTLAETLAENLTDEGYEVLIAENGDIGLTLIRSEVPDLIILDLMMPEMDCFAVMDALKMDQVTAHIPVIVATAKELTPDEKTRLGTQIQTLMQKGDFLNDEFLKEVEALIK